MALATNIVDSMIEATYQTEFDVLKTERMKSVVFPLKNGIAKDDLLRYLRQRYLVTDIESKSGIQIRVSNRTQRGGMLTSTSIQCTGLDL